MTDFHSCLGSGRRGDLAAPNLSRVLNLDLSRVLQSPTSASSAVKIPQNVSLFDECVPWPPVCVALVLSALVIGFTEG